MGETLVPLRHRSRRRKRNHRQEVEADPTTFQPVDGADAHASPVGPLPPFPVEMDMSTAMSGALHRGLHDPAGHGVGPSFPSVHDDEATSRFDQATEDAIKARGRGLHLRAVINPQRGEQCTLHVEEGFSARGLAPI